MERNYYIVSLRNDPTILDRNIRISRPCASEAEGAKQCFGFYDPDTMTAVSTPRVTDIRTDERRAKLIEELQAKHAARFSGK